LSKRFQVIGCKFHDFVYRKRLITEGGAIENFRLMRLDVIYKWGGKKLRRKIIVYPCDVIPYVRKTLGVIEEVVREKLEHDRSYYRVEDILSQKYDFSLNSIKSALWRTRKAFDRFLSVGLIDGLDLPSWLKREKRSFVTLHCLYRERLVESGLELLNPFG
jgi:hypothetical protein